MKAKVCEVNLYMNEPGFTLPSNIGELGDDITELNLSSCSLVGAFGLARHEHTYRARKKPIGTLFQNSLN